jgi:hypothetical protein
MVFALATNFSTPNTGTTDEILEKAKEQQGVGIDLKKTETPAPSAPAENK